jgi:alpha-ketoglutaric semialdehyde dehydrogenase
MELTGQSIIGYRRGRKSGRMLNGFNPTMGEALPPAFYSAADEEIEEAVQLASESFGAFSACPGKKRAAFLSLIAENLERLGDRILNRAVAESGLSAARIRSERDRTCSQLRFFADIAKNGSWIDARIDHADPARLPVPKPDVRSMLRPLGPVAIFCAGNFPLAFSVAGGDTASALASGNTVTVLAHYAHPGTAELAGTAIRDAAFELGFPGGVFSLLYDSGHEVAQTLVRHPKVKAVGFTGSRSGGMALLKLAASRSEPIPFYAEMSSINPVFVLPSALDSRRESIAKDLHASSTLGVGQFCTNPGVVITMGESHTMHAFLSRFIELMSSTPPGIMLHRGIADSYIQAVGRRSRRPKVLLRSFGHTEGRGTECSATPAVFETDAQTWLADSDLQDEIFGPATLIVRAENSDQLLSIARSLYGNLTATILGDPDDLVAYPELIAVLEKKVGRVLFNSFPTGVEVCEAMVHGGPFPATSDGRSTSVGGRAILRFTRPLCYQNFPNVALPPELQDGNPLAIRRIEDGRYVMPSSSNP